MTELLSSGERSILEKHKFIVFCEEYHYNPVGAVRSIGEYGFTPDVIAYGNRERVVAASKYVGTVRHVDTVEEGYRWLLKEYANEPEKPIVIACDDKVASFCDEHYDEMEGRFIFYNAGSKGRITYFLNKSHMNELAEKHGLRIPKSFVVKRGEQSDKFVYPLLTKSISSNSGGWKKDVYICRNEEELSAAYREIQGDTILLQEYIEKKNELCIDGFSINGGNDVVFTIASTYNYIIPGKYAYDYSSLNLTDTELMKKLKAMIKEIGFEGIFCVEFLVDRNNELVFLEINLRNSGWSYTSTCVNMNMPVMWALGMIMHSIPGGAQQKIVSPFRSVAEFGDFSARVMENRMSLARWVKEMKHVDCFLLYNKKDPKPFFVFLFSKIRNYIWNRLLGEKSSKRGI